MKTLASPRIFLFLGMILLASAFSNQDKKEIQLDPRVKLHYSELELAKIRLVAPYKLEQLNFQYSSSFRIINQKGNPVKYNSSAFDVHNYERFRKENERVTFTLTRDGDAVELMSSNEVQEEYKKIQDNFKE